MAIVASVRRPVAWRCSLWYRYLWYNGKRDTPTLHPSWAWSVRSRPALFQDLRRHLCSNILLVSLTTSARCSAVCADEKHGTGWARFERSGALGSFTYRRSHEGAMI